MLHEFADVVDASRLPPRRKYLHYYVVGFVDCVGCFSVSVKKQKGARFGYVVDPVFTVSQHKQSGIVLELIRRVLGCGRVVPKPGQEDTMLMYVVDARRQLVEKVIPFFRKNKLIMKHHEFLVFAEVVHSLERGEHRTVDGFRNLLLKIYSSSSQNKHELEEALKHLDSWAGASETTSRELHRES